MARKPKSNPNQETQDSASPQMTDVERWLREIEDAKKASRDWHDSCKRIVERYRDIRNEATAANGQKIISQRRYNVLWSIMQTMQPLVYSDPPQPYISRRHNDKDPVARDASMLLQRALAYSLDGDTLHDALTEARDDYLLTSRGVVWHKYTPYFRLRESEDKTYVDNPKDVPEGAEPQRDDRGLYFRKQYDEKIYEECEVEHVLYSDFLHGAASKWRYVPWVARRVPMTRKEQIKRFGSKMGRVAPLTIHVTDAKQEMHDKTLNTDDAKGLFAKSEIWEIWDKTTRKVMWLCPQYKDGFLDEKDDILELDGFFPCPKPAYGTKTNDTLEPVPDPKEWQDIAMELDEVTQRIKLLTQALRVVGAYDAQIGDILKRILTQTDENDLIPIENWPQFSEQGGFESAIAWFPIEQIMVALEKLHQARARLLQELYDITGIADIIRGNSDPRETAKAQQIKGNFASKRLAQRQKEIARMARESLEIKAQIICKHYSDDYIREISSAEQVLVDAQGQFDVNRFAAALQLLRSAPLRRFRIKIDEKSLAQNSLEEDREERVAFMQGMSQLLSAAIPMGQQFPGMLPLLGELIQLAVRGFPIARSVESAIQEAIDQMRTTPPPAPQQGQQGSGQRPPTPEEMDIERKKLDLEGQRLGIERQKLLLQEKQMQNDFQLRVIELQMRQVNKARENDIRAGKVVSDAQAKVQQLNQQQQQSDQQAATEQMRMAHESEQAERDRMQARESEQTQLAERERDAARAAFRTGQNRAA